MEPRTDQTTTALQADPVIACCHYDGIFHRVIPDGDQFICTSEHEFGFGNAVEQGRFPNVEMALLFWSALIGRSIKIDD